MLKVVHIHTDPKFLKANWYYSEPPFSNTNVFIGENFDLRVVKPELIIVKDSKNDLNKVLEICSGSDMVVLYELDPVKAYLAVQIPTNIVVAWRFFGAELYHKKSEKYLTEYSIRFNGIKKDRIIKLLNCKIIYKRLLLIAKYGIQGDKFFVAALKRIDLFLGHSEHEYDHIVKVFGKLPQFIQIPLKKYASKNVNHKEDVVIVGNSRSIYNNHIDILEVIENSKCYNQLSFMVPFSYGIENCYTKEIRKIINSAKKQISLLDNFIPYEAYINLVTKAKAAVFNNLRQMALGNIFVLLNSGTKIYMNNQNIICTWLKDNGIKIFDVSELNADLNSNNLELSTEEKDWNIKTLNNMLLNYTEEKFISEIKPFFKKELS